MDFTKHVRWINETNPSYLYTSCPYTCCDTRNIVLFKQAQDIDFCICIEPTQVNAVFVLKQGDQSGWAIWSGIDKKFQTGGFSYPLVHDNSHLLKLLKDQGLTIRKGLRGEL